MTTPNRKAITERATELWRINRMRSGQPYELTPEESELREEGFLTVAQQDLTRNTDEYEQYLLRE